ISLPETPRKQLGCFWQVSTRPPRQLSCFWSGLHLYQQAAGAACCRTVHATRRSRCPTEGHRGHVSWPQPGNTIMDSQPNPATTPATADGIDPAVKTTYNAAFEKHLAQIKAMKPDELLPVNLDVRATVATALGALPKIRALRESIAGLG